MSALSPAPPFSFCSPSGLPEDIKLSSQILFITVGNIRSCTITNISIYLVRTDFSYIHCQESLCIQHLSDIAPKCLCTTFILSLPKKSLGFLSSCLGYSLQKYSGSHPRQAISEEFTESPFTSVPLSVCDICTIVCTGVSTIVCGAVCGSISIGILCKTVIASLQGKDPREFSGSHEARSHLRYSQYCSIYHQTFSPGR